RIPLEPCRRPRLTAFTTGSTSRLRIQTGERFHFGFDDGDGFFNPASCAFAALRLSAYSLPSIGATCGGSLSRYGRPIPSSVSWASIHFHKASLEIHRCALVAPATLTISAASPWP